MTLPLFKQYIDGQFETGSRQFDSLNPATEQVWAQVAQASPADVDRAVRAAEQAFNSAQWRATTATARGKLLYKLADLLLERSEEIAAIETRDTGKIIRETSSQIAYIADYYRYFAGLADKIEGKHLPIDKADMEVWLKQEPVGVVAAIVPWNSQLFLSAVKIAPAIAAGCTIVLKASEQGPAAMMAFAELVDQAGIPKGVVNIISGFADCGEALVSHPMVNHIAFTGGPETAQHIVKASAKNLATTTLELGGKSPFIVFDDADLDSAANAQVAGIFAATGQSCVAGSRLIVHADVKEKLVAILKQKAESIRIGSPEDMQTEVGPLCTLAQRQKIETLLAQSIDQGAEVVTGGSAIEGTGYYYPPTIIDCSNAQQPTKVPCVAQELFGPVLSVLTFQTEAEAIALANDSNYGMAAGLFTQKLSRAHRLVNQIRSGIVWINTYRAISPMAPFGGYGLSGNSREGGIQAMQAYMTNKAVWLRTSDDPIPDPFVMR